MVHGVGNKQGTEDAAGMAVCSWYLLDQPGLMHVLMYYSLKIKNLMGMINASLGCIDHEIVESKILRGMRKEGSNVQTLDFRITNFSFFSDLVRSHERHI